jgi:hypothetical protein
LNLILVSLIVLFICLSLRILDTPNVKKMCNNLTYMQTILSLVSIVIKPRAESPRIYGLIFERWRMFSPYCPDRKSSSKLLGRDTEHSSACTAEAKNVCSYKSTFLCPFASYTERTLHFYPYKQNITHILHSKISNILVF